MKLATRLDAVVKVRERQADKALRRWANATGELERAKEKMREALEALRLDFRRRSTAAEWELTEQSFARDSARAQRVTEAVNRASSLEQAERSRFVEARAQADAMRRAADARREELRRERERAEQRQLDETAGLLYSFGPQ